MWDIAWTGSHFVAVGTSKFIDGRILVSRNGVDWVNVPQPLRRAIFMQVEWTGSRLILAGSKEDFLFIVTSGLDALGIRAGAQLPGGFTWNAEGGGLTARLAPDDRLVR